MQLGGSIGAQGGESKGDCETEQKKSVGWLWQEEKEKGRQSMCFYFSRHVKQG